jgi:DtxR family Mn-dependent transcriptional regulator
MSEMSIPMSPGDVLAESAEADPPRALMSPPVVSLLTLRGGDHARIVHLALDEPALLTRLSNLGVIPGVRVRLRQRRPAAVIEVGGTTLALDREIAARIRVQRL